jgi:predicted TIM-barrel fold metal-dependent hydrolase
VRRPVAQMTFRGGKYVCEMGSEGPLADWWEYEDRVIAHTRLSAAAGFAPDEVLVVPMTFDEMRPGCYRQAERLADMDLNWVDASICFPTFPRFCGQTFLEADDKELALRCVQAYNDWMVDEWCAGSDGRLVPLCLIPLWDPVAAGEEVRRNAARGVRAVAFSECPAWLGLPSIHSGYWDPFFEACNETKTVVNMHIGSSSKMPSTSADAPAAVGSTLTFGNAMSSMTDWLFSGWLARLPELKLSYSEGQIGWIPYILERADKVWEDNRAWGGVSDVVTEPPSTYYYRQIYGCFFDDEYGLDNLEKCGVSNICFETDYPHSDSTWPHSKETAQKLMGHLPAEIITKRVRGNAIEMLGLDFTP